MANSNIPPLLCPPPINATHDPSIMHTWLNNIYIYLFQTTTTLNNATASINEMEADIIALEALPSTANTWTGVQQYGTIGGTVGKFVLAGSTSGSSVINAAAVAGSTTFTLQGTSGTIYSSGGGTLVSVTDGGTGVATMTTAYAPVCAGTTATGTLQVASTGLSTSGNVLTSTGNASLPTFQALPAQGFAQLSSAVYSNQAAVSLPTVFSGYTAYKIVLEDVFSSSGSAQIVLNFSTDGSTYDSTSGHYACQTLTASGVTLTGASGITTGIGLIGTANVGTTIVTGLSGEYMVTNPSTTTGYVRTVGNGIVSTSSSACITEQVVGQYNQTGTTVKGFKLTSSTGNISGTVKVYGML